MKKLLSNKKFRVFAIAVFVIFALLRLSNFSVSKSKSYIYDSHAASHDSLHNSTFVLEKPFNLIIHSAETTCINKDNAEYTIEVFVESKNKIGWQRFIPFYKYIPFQSDVKYRWSTPMATANIDVTDAFSLHGSFSVLGFISAKSTKKKIEEYINQEISKKIEMRLW